MNTRKNIWKLVIPVIMVGLAMLACTQPTAVLPTAVPPTAVPPTAVPPTAVPPTPALSAGMEPDTDRPGMDYRDFDLPSPDPELCRSACLAEAQCVAYTYVKPASSGQAARCWLKSGVPPATRNTCCISGVKAVTPGLASPTAPSAPVAPTPAPPTSAPPTLAPPTPIPPTPIPPTPVPAPVIKSFTANPAAILAGGSSTLQWEVVNATSVQIDQGVGSVAASGSKQVSPAATTTYQLTAESAGGTVTKQVQVQVRMAATLYSWWNSDREDNFATTNPKWSGKVGDTKEGYTLHRIEGLVYHPDEPQPPGTVPIYSWWNSDREDNFTTTNQKWSGKVGDTKEGYTLVRIEGFMYDPGQAQPPDTRPVYSWWNSDREDNFTTTNPKWSGKVGDTKEGYTLYRIEGYLIALD